MGTGDALQIRPMRTDELGNVSMSSEPAKNLASWLIVLINYSGHTRLPEYTREFC